MTTRPPPTADVFAHNSAHYLAMLHWLGVKPSYSRPRVSDGNAFAKSLFHNVKYRPDFPVRGFADLEQNSPGHAQPGTRLRHKDAFGRPQCSGLGSSMIQATTILHKLTRLPVSQRMKILDIVKAMVGLLSLGKSTSKPLSRFGLIASSRRNWAVEK
jgi:transposase InsO family protein